MDAVGSVSTESELNRSKWIWGGVIFGFLGLELVMCGVAAFFATSDPSFAVVPEYHRKAMNWDDSRRLDANSKALGWTAVLDVDQYADEFGQRKVEVRLLSRGSEPIENASVRIQLYHHARAHEVSSVALQEVAGHPGVYSATARLPKAGLWSSHVEVDHGPDHFVLNQDVDVGGSRRAD